MGVKTVYDASLTSVADAIRAKTGGSAALEFPTEFVSAISAIPSGGGAQVKTGTFTGDGTINAALSIGFEPDIVVIASGQDYATSGWAGVGDIIIIKGNVSFIGRHNSATATAITANGNPNMGNAYGDTSTAPNYTPYGTYSGGTLSISNKNDGAGTRFGNGTTYTWYAVKLS